MNQELKQRLIGAVVVTALAAIFIPMLFDDPVDNSGQSVSELVIPANPVNTGEESANKLPSSADQILNTPEAGSETAVNTEEEAELPANNEPPQNAPQLDDEPIADTEEGGEQAIDEPVNDRSSGSLDTGVVNKTGKAVKPKKKLPETELSSEKPAIKPPLEADTAVEAPKNPANKTEVNAVKPVKPRTELSRWYVQAGTFSKKENAMSLMETLRKQGLPVTMETTKGAGNAPLYRLIVGPALEKKRAAEMKAKLDSQKIKSILIAE